MACNTAEIVYFHGRGRAETTRWALAAAGIPFTNTGLDTYKEFSALRDSGALPFGQLPLLKYKGENHTQSSAMIRFVAREGGLYGTTNAEQTRIDELIGVTEDAASLAMGYPFVDDKEARKQQMSAFVDKYFPYIEKFIASNTDSSVWAVGTAMSIADVVLAEAVEAYIEILCSADFLNGYPRIAAIHSAVLKSDGIKQYLESDKRFPLGDAEYTLNVNTVLGRV